MEKGIFQNIIDKYYLLSIFTYLRILNYIEIGYCLNTKHANFLKEENINNVNSITDNSFITDIGANIILNF